MVIEVHWTCGSIEEARKVCRILVKEGLVACAQIIPWIESIYIWNDQLETAQEAKVVLKTLEHHFEKVKACILQHCSYEVPEVSKIPLTIGTENYLEWLKKTCE